MLIKSRRRPGTQAKPRERERENGAKGKGM